MTPPPGSGNIEQIQMAPGAPSAAAAGDTAMRENAGDTTPERAREVTLWDLYRLAMADDGTQDIENTREEISEDESDAESDNSGSGSDLDAVEFESCKLLGIKPESFHEPRGVPTFRPTAEQFADFAAFIKAVEPWGRRRGLVKASPPGPDSDDSLTPALQVIPPPEWFEALGDPVNYVPELASQFPIKTPINQHFQGNSGQYRQLNVEDRRAKWSFAQFAEAALSEERRPACLARKKRRDRDNPGSDSDDEGATTSRRRGFRGSAGQKRSRKNKSEGDEKQETNVGKSSAAAVQTEEVESGAVTETESSKITQPDASHLPTPPRDLDEAKQISDAAAPLARKTRTAEKARTTDASSLESLPTELIAAFAKMDKLLPPEIIPDLEREYWRTLTYAAPMYGADQLGSLFPKDFKHGWNLRNLDNLLSRAKLTLPGVTDPYVYAGMWKSTFAWHLEDMDLYSINYVHMVGRGAHDPIAL